MSGNGSVYYKSYEDLEVHELMLKDEPRLSAYHNAIMKNKDLFINKVVLDVGAGTGILSVLCAKAGARRVYAIEASNVAEIALKTVEENNVSSIVDVLNSRVEDVHLPEKADIIISEWMGFYLLHESMIDSILFARDHFLKTQGIVFPSECAIYIAPCEVPGSYDDFQDIKGVRLTSFAERLRKQKSASPCIQQVSPHDLLHNGVDVIHFKMQEVTVKQLENIRLKTLVPIQRCGTLQGFCIWFTCNFLEGVSLSTAPCAPVTHWKQCLLLLPESACEMLEEGAPVAFEFSMTRSTDFRKYDLAIEILDPNEIEHSIPCNCFMTKCILLKTHLSSIQS